MNEVTGAQVDADSVAVTIYVDAAKGDDAAPGIRGRPVRTLRQAAALARSALEAGGVRLLLAAGTYREAVAIEPPATAGPLIIEGAKTGAVLISGSDDWSSAERWSPVPGRPGLLVAPWPRDWGDPMVRAADGPTGRHPPGLARASAPDDGTAVIEWTPPDNLADLAGYRIDRRPAASGDAAWHEVMRLGPRTGRLVDESVLETASAAAAYAYRVAALDATGAVRGISRAVCIHTGPPRAPVRATVVGRRREMVFVNDTLLRQADSIDDLTPGTFCVDDGSPEDAADGRLYLALPTGVRRGACTIEVALWPDADRAAGLLTIAPKANATGHSVVVRNLVFEHHAGAGPDAAALRIDGCRNVFIEDCTFRWNNATGVRVASGADVTLQRCTALHNGSSGVCCTGSVNVLAEDIDVSDNNWRGDCGGVQANGVAGVVLGPGAGRCRLLSMHAEANRCPGVWLRRATGHVIVENLRAVDNQREGLVISDPDGPVVVRGATLARNTRSGLLLAGAQHGVLEDSILYGNAGGQVEVLPPPSPHTEPNDTLARQPGGSVSHWRWRNNVVVATDVGAPLVRAPADAIFIRTLNSARNLWYGPDEAHAFLLAEMGFPLEVWQQVTGQDLASRFADPRFRNPEALDFRPQGASPIETRDAWPAPAAMPANLIRLSTFRAARAEATTAPPYPALTRATGVQWHPLDLRAAANRALTGRDAWLGSPLPELAPGRRTMHGVPFVILDEQTNAGQAAIVLRSARVRTTGGAAMPTEVTVPVGRKARTVYVLHGCAHGNRFAAAAFYDVVYADGTIAALDVVPLGEAPDNAQRLDQRKRLATIQDWRPEALQFTSDRARHGMIVGQDNPASRVRYLYTVRWPNPHPEKTIRTIRLASADPDQDVTVGVLAITLRLE